jgi:cobalt/nickel transport system permease protein
VGSTHSHRLLVHGPSGAHRLAPECKVLAAVAFVFAVVATPREVFWAFGLHAAIVVVVALAARVSPVRLATRLVIELPFLAFALFLPVVGRGERVDLWGLSLSVPGLWGAWNILVKGSLSVAATSLLAATTTVPELLRGLERLRMPKVIVAIASFMIRYGDVIVDDMRRMKIARQSRGHDPRWLWQARAVATSAGALFIRSFERGERVYVAMLSRGYDGSLPDLDNAPPVRRDWVRASFAPLAATSICVMSVALT